MQELHDLFTERLSLARPAGVGADRLALALDLQQQGLEGRAVEPRHDLIGQAGDLLAVVLAEFLMGVVGAREIELGVLEPADMVAQHPHDGGRPVGMLVVRCTRHAGSTLKKCLICVSV